MEKSADVSKKPLKITLKVLSILMIAIIIAIGCLAVWILIDKLIIGSYAPRIFGYSFYNVGSGSMSGEIEINDLIVVKETNDYEIDDIVTYLRDGDSVPTTHRIIGITSDGKYITKGDANNTEDRFPISEEEILGEVVKIKPGAGARLTWLQSQGWIYICGIAVLLTIGSFFLDMDKKED